MAAVNGLVAVACLKQRSCRQHPHFFNTRWTRASW